MMRSKKKLCNVLFGTSYSNTNKMMRFTLSDKKKNERVKIKFHFAPPLNFLYKQMQKQWMKIKRFSASKRHTFTYLYKQKFMKQKKEKIKKKKVGEDEVYDNFELLGGQVTSQYQPSKNKQWLFNVSIFIAIFHIDE